MSGDVIKSFLVGLGFGVDDASLAKFNKAIASATLKVAALYGSIKVMSGAVIFGLSQISEGFEKMGYEYRIIAPAINKALQLRRELLKAYAAAGINITKVIQSSVRLNFSLAKTKFAFEAIYRSVASRFFGILTKQSDLFRQKLYANLPRIQSVLERFIQFIFKSIEATTQLGVRLFSILGRVYDFFVKLDKATDGWSTVVLGVIAAWKLLNLSFLATPLGLLITGFTALLALWDDLKTFKEGGQSLINWGSDTTRIMFGLAAGIGAVAIAIKTWSVISAIIGLVQSLNAALSITDVLIVIAEAPFLAIAAAIGAIIIALTLADQKWKIFNGSLADFFGGLGGKILGFLTGTQNINASGGPGFGAPTAQTEDQAKGLSGILGGIGAGVSKFFNSSSNIPSNLGKGTGGISPVSPISGAAQSSQTNQNVNQQTSIHVNGVADANAVGKAVSGEQSKVNFDLVRNLRGSTR